jgi:PhzF family phenazine biosynthesis protein
MRIPIYQVDAFTSELFSGNPAAVCILDGWLDDKSLTAISAENNLSETAFLVKSEQGFEIRWFTPLTEVARCGHATLASSFIIFNKLQWPQGVIHFQTRESGILSVKRNGELLEMDFPAIPTFKQTIPDGLVDDLNHSLLEVLGTDKDLLAVVEDEKAVRELEPNLLSLMKIEKQGIIVTASGVQCDFVSRYFAPRLGVSEDPVTGSSHCILAPYWAKRLGKKQLHARQVSKRGGELFCEDSGERVTIAGKAVLYLEGRITL